MEKLVLAILSQSVAKKLAKTKVHYKYQCPKMIKFTLPVREELFSPLKNKTNNYDQ